MRMKSGSVQPILELSGNPAPLPCLQIREIPLEEHKKVPTRSDLLPINEPTDDRW